MRFLLNLTFFLTLGISSCNVAASQVEKQFKGLPPILTNDFPQERFAIDLNIVCQELGLKFICYNIDYVKWKRTSPSLDQTGRFIHRKVNRGSFMMTTAIGNAFL